MPQLFTIPAGVGALAHFAWRVAAAAPAALARPGETARQTHAVLLGALPLGMLGGITLGTVLWMHTHAALVRTGAGDYLPTILAAAVLLELAPLGAGLIVAARSGSSLGAELGAMRIGEQIDAIAMLGVSPMKALVAPRVLACVVALPLLHIVIATLAILSGYAAESLAGDTNWLRYQTGCLKELYPNEVIPAGLKTIVFGFLIGTSACYRGLRAEGGAEGVGRAATSAVVLASVLVLAADVVLVGIIQALFG